MPNKEALLVELNKLTEVCQAAGGFDFKNPEIQKELERIRGLEFDPALMMNAVNARLGKYSKKNKQE